VQYTASKNLKAIVASIDAGVAQTPGTDGAGRACGAGTYNANGVGACYDHTTCTAGLFLNFQSAFAAGSCYTCTAGTYNTNGVGACSDHATCSAGEFLSGESTSAPGSCSPCTTGTYNANGVGACSDHTTCSAGQELTGESASAAGSCSSCPAGTHNTNGLDDCADHTTCSAGQELTGESASAAGSCSTCTAGTYNTNGFNDCVDHTTCSAEQYLTGESASAAGSCATRTSCDGSSVVQNSAGSTTTDRTCQCASGYDTYSSNSNSCRSSYVAPVCANPVTNGNFQNGETGWSEYNHSPRRNGYHNHNFGGITTGHLHGSCPSTGGGIQQSIGGFNVGQTYRITYKAWSGYWDGHDTDYVQTMIAGNSWNVGVDQHHEVQDGANHYQLITHNFVATSTSHTLKIYAAHTQCIDVDDISIADSRCFPSICGTNPVTNGNFQNGKIGWSEYNHSPRRNGYHNHNFGGITTGHLHGYCPSTGGGIQQSIGGFFEVGQTYRITFKAWSGSWDGHDTDYVQTMIAGNSWTVGVDQYHEVQDGANAYQLITHYFVATSISHTLKIYAAHTQCIDVDDINIEDIRCPS
jgi:hypothetical protein